MLWNSTAKTVVQTMLKEAQEKATRERKDNTVRRLSYYHDEQESYIIEQLEKHHADPDAFTPVFFNVVKKIINQLSMVYMADATREIVGSAQDQAIFAEIVESANLNLKMKTASRFTQLLKTIMLRPVWRQGKMDLDILTGDILDVEIGDTVEQLKTVMVSLYPQSGESKDIEYSLWTDETYTRLDYNGNILQTEPNPYLAIPMVPVWNSYPATGGFWLPGGEDLVSCQSTINERLVNLMLVLEYQGMGIPIARGLPPGGNLKIGPNIAVEIENPEGSLTFEKTNAPIQAILNSIQFLITQLALTNGLSAASMSVKPTQESGLSRISGSAELTELRKDQISLFGRYERQLFNMFRTVWNVHNPTKKISDTARLKIDFFDPRPVMSPDKQAELWAAELEMGTISRTNILMLKNPDLSKEDANKKLAEIQAENQTFNLSSPGTLSQPEE